MIISKTPDLPQLYLPSHLCVKVLYANPDRQEPWPPSWGTHALRARL